MTLTPFPTVVVKREPLFAEGGIMVMEQTELGGVERLHALVRESPGRLIDRILSMRIVRASCDWRG